jgi:hypothetical protein
VRRRRFAFGRRIAFRRRGWFAFGGGSPLTGPSGGDQSCGGGQGSQDQRINDLLKQIMQMLGPLLQMFSQLLNLMLDNSATTER